ncbi:MAG: hypothetical protein JXA46_04275 [Dehalococcoidales bacterium]|nr:hypothetical protein [Dehalococcoidales bacterium]
MKTLKQKTITFVLLSIMIISSLTLFPSNAFADETVDTGQQCLTLNPEQQKMVTDLWGKDITFIEFLKEVAPVVLEKVPYEMILQASVSDLHWSMGDYSHVDISNGIQICWRYLVDDEKEVFWVSVIFEEKEIAPIVLSCIKCKPIEVGNVLGKRMSLTYDGGIPSIGQLKDVIPAGDEHQNMGGEELPLDGQNKSMPDTSKDRDTKDFTSEAHAKAWTDDPLFGRLTQEEAWQEFTWDGSYVTGIPDQGGKWERYWPFWVHVSGYYSDNGPTPPASYHATYAEGQFEYYQGGSEHEINVFSYAYGNGTVNGACNFSGSLPYDGMCDTEFEYWTE